MLGNATVSNCRQTEEEDDGREMHSSEGHRGEDKSK